MSHPVSFVFLWTRYHANHLSSLRDLLNKPKSELTYVSSCFILCPSPIIAYRIASNDQSGRQLTIPVNMRSLWWRNMK